MYPIYSLLLCLGFLILLPRFLVDAFRHGKYVAGFGERLGAIAPVNPKGKPVVWLHSVSVGETQAARPLVKAIKQRFPDHLIAVSTITRTGQQLAREVFKDDAIRVFYFPFDWRWTVRRALSSINPSIVLIMETELWPNFLRECAEQQIPVALVNGRLSDKSFRRYQIIKSFMTRVLSSLQLAAMQTEADAERLRALGIKPEKTSVLGSLKFDAGTMQLNEETTTSFRTRFGVGKDSQLILAASTHAPEEKIVLEAFKQVTSQSPEKLRLMIAPRHPERFEDVADLLAGSGFSWARKTKPAQAGDAEVDIVLLDTIGELSSAYPLATVVFVGGSIAPTGGHNILEPAAVGACVITGPHTFNFQSIVETFVAAGAVVQLPQNSDLEMTAALAQAMANLIGDTSQRQELGERALRLVMENRGATERTVVALEPLLKVSAIKVEHPELLHANSAPIS